MIEDSVIESPIPASEFPTLAPSPNAVVPMLIGSTLAEVERELVLQTFASCHGNRTRAARLLGVAVRTLRNKIRLYAENGLDVPVKTPWQFQGPR